MKLLDCGYSPGSPQGGSVGARIALSLSPSQQLPLGYGPTGSWPEECPGGEGRCGPSRFCCSSGEGVPTARLPSRQPFEMPRIHAAVLLDFDMNFQDKSGTLPSLAEEYRQRYPVGCLDNTTPLPPTWPDPPPLSRVY
ncbi:hypothetical protein LIER_36839 [Lithospermum erythrorhizon]|uniref:Uncharacterized protein n=1 Tax=Lithospermum erythrorhizon TaxID=34254 RepID=A0AAV3PCY3_LITER